MSLLHSLAAVCCPLGPGRRVSARFARAHTGTHRRSYAQAPTHDASVHKDAVHLLPAPSHARAERVCHRDSRAHCSQPYTASGAPPLALMFMSLGTSARGGDLWVDPAPSRTCPGKTLERKPTPTEVRGPRQTSAAPLLQAQGPPRVLPAPFASPHSSRS